MIEPFGAILMGVLIVEISSVATLALTHLGKIASNTLSTRQIFYLYVAFFALLFLYVIGKLLLTALRDTGAIA